MTIGVPTETSPGERRVSIVPAGVGALVRAGCAVRVSAGAGREAGIADADYEEAGALVVPDRGSVFSEADAIVQVRGGGANPDSGMADVELLREGQVLIGFL
ncbi:MAG: NAD(P)(+) transhydrogenase (Re/Si-specific) subunit alpha, partial [Gemmatimonadetes bacterium]|nr:NAD(P)(+) transhydrogenase (Re/Si-specific) subunit alpha [Gemmatimonadota bacterium]